MAWTYIPWSKKKLKLMADIYYCKNHTMSKKVLFPFWNRGLIMFNDDFFVPTDKIEKVELTNLGRSKLMYELCREAKVLE